MLGGRSPERLWKAAFAPHTYLALWAMLSTYVKPVDAFRRYVFGRGEYPHQVAVRSPTGIVKPTLFTKHDILTLNEIFCRQDYRAKQDIRVVLDIGANIGLSALYFLTRNEKVHVYLYEPNPGNIAKLKVNLSGFEDRYTLVDKAVSTESGEFSFGVEESGRYGGLGKDLGSQASYEQPPIEQLITVECMSINQVLKEIVANNGNVDIIKIDTEGSEFDIVSAIDEQYQPVVETIYAESQDEPSLPGFRTDKFKTVYRLIRV